jgi:hypothetical protein
MIDFLSALHNHRTRCGLQQHESKLSSQPPLDVVDASHIDTRLNRKGTYICDKLLLNFRCDSRLTYSIRQMTSFYDFQLRSCPHDQQLQAPFARPSLLRSANETRRPTAI